MKFKIYLKSKVTFETKIIKLKAESKDGVKKLFKKKYKWMLENWKIWKIKEVNHD
jgi:hypothetical protein